MSLLYCFQQNSLCHPFLMSPCFCHQLCLWSWTCHCHHFSLRLTSIARAVLPIETCCDNNPPASTRLDDLSTSFFYLLLNWLPTLANLRKESARHHTSYLFRHPLRILITSVSSFYFLVPLSAMAFDDLN